MASNNTTTNNSTMDSITKGYKFEWKNQTVCFTSTLETLRNADNFTDVSIKCRNGKTVKAHRIILSAMSSYFHEMFLEYESKHPIIVLKDIEHGTLQDIITYMYTGEVTVDKKNVGSFLQTASLFKVKSLNEYFDFNPPSNSCTTTTTASSSTTANTTMTTNTTKPISSTSSGTTTAVSQETSQHFDKRANENYQPEQIMPSIDTRNNENQNNITNKSSLKTQQPSTSFSLDKAPETDLCPLPNKNSVNHTIIEGNENNPEVPRTITKQNILQKNNEASNNITIGSNDGHTQVSKINEKESEPNSSVNIAKIVMKPQPPPPLIPNPTYKTKTKQQPRFSTTTFNNLQKKPKLHNIISNLNRRISSTINTNSLPKNSENGNFNAPLDLKLSKTNDISSKIISARSHEKSPEKAAFSTQLNLKRKVSPLNNSSKVIMSTNSKTNINNNNGAFILPPPLLSVPIKKRRLDATANNNIIPKPLPFTKNNTGHTNSSVPVPALSSTSSEASFCNNNSNMNASKRKGFPPNVKNRYSITEKGKISEDINATGNEQYSSLLSTTKENPPSINPSLIPKPTLGSKSNPKIQNNSATTNNDNNNSCGLISTPNKINSAHHSIPTTKSTQENNTDKNTELENGHGNESHVTCLHDDGRCDSGKFVCSICGRRYQHERSLSDHMKSHNGETLCLICEKEGKPKKIFSKKANLLSHLKTKHGDFTVESMKQMYGKNKDLN